MPPPQNKNRRTGFTLIELIVVVGILGILTIFGIGATGRMKQTALKTKCMANLRHIGIAANIYATENNSDYPIVADTALGLHPNPNFPGLINLLGELLPEQEMFYCPDSSNATPDRNSLWTYRYQRDRADGANFFQMGYFWTVASGPGFWQIDLPQKTHGKGQRALGMCLHLGAAPHGGKINCLFADGHIESTSKGLSDIDQQTLLFR